MVRAMCILIVGALLCKECDAGVNNLLGPLGGGPLTLHCGIVSDTSVVRDVVTAHTPTPMRFGRFEDEDFSDGRQQQGRSNRVFNYKEDLHIWHKQVKKLRRGKRLLDTGHRDDRTFSVEARIAQLTRIIQAIGVICTDVITVAVCSVVSVAWFASILFECISQSRLRIIGQTLLDALLLAELKKTSPLAVGTYILRVANIHCANEWCCKLFTTLAYTALLPHLESHEWYYLVMVCLSCPVFGAPGKDSADTSQPSDPYVQTFKQWTHVRIAESKKQEGSGACDGLSEAVCRVAHPTRACCNIPASSVRGGGVPTLSEMTEVSSDVEEPVSPVAPRAPRYSSASYTGAASNNQRNRVSVPNFSEMVDATSEGIGEALAPPDAKRPRVGKATRTMKGTVVPDVPKMRGGASVS